ncbi:MmgE/PrpD family protein [Roseibacterium beibuensis]|uniref:MmgE/PrpD family protein n=1 Tax=[Roseibacterium] beibuensis TaxID=1193142 RepID=A0ABP9KRK6_9RHOB|nr:MmgE/PrpD family protein [Roseibacterium beibuensis]MCS6622453.1 MmgE/PrpD family protein [Roseibacterium beibuensis]
MTDFATQDLAQWCNETMAAPLPPKVAHQANRCILDVVACASAGQDAPAVTACLKAAQSLYAAGSASVWFRGMSLGPVAAGMVNATAAMVLDMDDGNRQAMGHPGAGVVPAVLALAETLGADWCAIQKAIVIGYEVAVRVGRAEQRPSYHSANYTSFGVTAAAACLMGLSQDQIAHALGICAYYGPRVSDLTLSCEMGSDVKESLPWSVVVGISAGELAGKGFLGNRDALDIEERFNRDAMLQGLGQTHLILNTYFKRYSCCRWMHASVEGLLSIMSDLALTHDQIERVEVQTFTQAASLNNRHEPDTLIDAQFSVPYAMAIAAVQGESCLMPMTARVLHHQATEAFAKKVSLHVSDAMNDAFPAKTPSRVTVISALGTFAAQVDAPWGEPVHAPTDEELIDKFLVVGGSILSPQITKELSGRILSGAEPAETLGLLRSRPDASKMSQGMV